MAGNIILLYFGAYTKISSYISGIYRSLFMFELRGRDAKLEEFIVTIRFIDEKTIPTHRAQVLEMIQLAFAGLRVPMFHFADNTLTRKIQAKGEALARDGYIPSIVPMEVLYMQRTFGGMFLLGARLRAKLPVADMLAPYLEG